MVPINPVSKKRKATATPSSAKRGVDKRRTTNVFLGNTDDGVDRISYLPNSILGCILTLLSITEATRMALLSKTWWNVLGSPYYKLESINDADLWRGQRRPCDRRYYLKQSGWRSGVITSLLDTRHQSTIRRFIIQRTFMSDDVVSGWLYKLCQSGVVEELVLEMPLPDPVGLSHYIFNCSSLWSLSLSNCSWPQSKVQASYSLDWTLPRLTELTLSHMDMTMKAVKDLLMRCPSLLSLSLSYPRHGGLLDIIHCRNLLSLTISCWRYVVRIMDTPKLERLLWWPLAPQIIFERTMMEQLPRLHTIGMLQHCPVQEGVMLEHVRTISLFTNVDNLEDLNRTIGTLRHLPHLQTLHIKMKDGSGSDSRKNKPISFEELVGSPLACLDNSVKTIVLRVNNLVRLKLAFTNYLLGAAKSLRYMLIYKKRMAGELLPQESRGSSGAQIEFYDNGSKCTLDFDTSASNFKLADPFML